MVENLFASPVLAKGDGLPRGVGVKAEPRSEFDGAWSSGARVGDPSAFFLDRCGI